MEKLIMIGTGHAMTLECFNTCFVLQNNKEEGILVDTGGGLQILKQLQDANVDITKIHDIIISHKHTDHVLGIFWIIRYINRFLVKGDYDGNLNIYMHKELEEVVRSMCEMLFDNKYLKWIDNRIIFRVVEDKEEVKILNYNIKFLDMHSKKVTQFGFKTMLENGKTLAFLGDETFKEELRKELLNVDWLLHESMCMDEEANIYKPYEKSHSTAKTAAQVGESLNAKNLVLYHANDNNLKNRKRLYTNEAKKYFSGNVFVPDDLDVIEL